MLHAIFFHKKGNNARKNAERIREVELLKVFFAWKKKRKKAQDKKNEQEKRKKREKKTNKEHRRNQIRLLGIT